MLIYYWKLPILYHNLKWFYISYKKRIEIQETDFTLCTQGTKNSLNLKVIFPIILQKPTEVTERFPWSIHELQARIMELYFALNFRVSASNRFHQSKNPYPQCVPRGTFQQCPWGGKGEWNSSEPSHPFLEGQPANPVHKWPPPAAWVTGQEGTWAPARWPSLCFQLPAHLQQKRPSNSPVFHFIYNPVFWLNTFVIHRSASHSKHFEYLPFNTCMKKIKYDGNYQ